MIHKSGQRVKIKNSGYVGGDRVQERGWNQGREQRCPREIAVFYLKLSGGLTGVYYWAFLTDIDAAYIL